MLVASDSESDLPVFPLLSCASTHDSHGFLNTFFRMKSFLPDYKVSKLLLDSAHDAMPYYEYCKRENITHFIDLNGKGGVKLAYKNDFTIVKMVFLYANKIFTCTMMVLSHQSIVSNIDVHLLAENMAALVSILALIQNMEGLFI